MGKLRVTVDTGGTFSDFVCLDEDTGTISITKLPSTPDDPSRAILDGIETLLADGIRAEDITFLCHGTTVGTNALLEGKGAKTALLVTEGFRGIYEVGEQARPYGAAIFDVMYDKPPMLVPRSLTAEVSERVDFRGEVLRPLDEEALRATLRDLARQQPASIAVCLLFSFLYPAARGARRRHHRRGTAGMQHFAVVGGAAPDPRVLSAVHHRDQRLSPADPRTLHRQSRPPPRRRRRRDAAEIHHAVQWRHVDLRSGGASGGDDRAVGPGRRRDGGRCGRSRAGHPGHHHLRHGRHLLRRRPDPGWPAAGVGSRQDRGARHRRADDGYQHGERRRRDHRRSERPRRDRSGAAKRRCDAGPRLLRPWRTAHHHGLQSRARLSLRRQFPRRPHAARCRTRAYRDRNQSRGSPRHAGRAGRGGRDPHHRRQDGGGHQGDLDHARP